MVKRKINKGIYLIIDPSMETDLLMEKLQTALQSGICAVQIWDNFPISENIEILIKKVCRTAHKYDVPVIINNKWDLIPKTDLDGVHFDEIPPKLKEIKKQCGKEIIVGVTCGNEIEKIEWSAHNEIDYLSFCSIFPSKTQNSCELVSFETISNTLDKYNIPVFLAGGITPNNISELNQFSYSGIAVVSGIMNSENPGKEIDNYLKNSNLPK